MPVSVDYPLDHRGRQHRILVPIARAECDRCTRKGPPVECRPLPRFGTDTPALELAMTISGFYEHGFYGPRRRPWTVLLLCHQCAAEFFASRAAS